MTMVYCFAEFANEVFNDGRGNGVQRGTWLVHEYYFRVDGDCSCDAEISAVGRPKAQYQADSGGRGLLPTVRFFSGNSPRFGPFRLILRQAVNSRAIGNVIVNGFGKGVGFLKHHAHLDPQRNHIDVLIVDVLTVQFDFPGDPADVDGVIHAIQATQEGRFTAS